jgi:hypothetical protein
VSGLTLVLVLGVTFVLMEGSLVGAVFWFVGSRRSLSCYPDRGFFLIGMSSVPFLMAAAVLFFGW